MNINTVIIEKNIYLREGWNSIIELEDDMQVTACFENCNQALNSEHLKDADVIIMNVVQEGMSAAEGITRIKQVDNDKCILIISASDKEKPLFKALKAGAIGYVDKNVSPSEFASTIRDTYNGISPITPPIAQKILNLFQPANFEKANILSKKELIIIRELSNGTSYAAIAEQNFMSVDLVRYHIRNMYKKLHQQQQSNNFNSDIISR